MTLFEQLGGEDRLRTILRTFYDRVFSDAMIGFFFRKLDKERLIELEYQLMANAFGAEVEYEGRSMANAHAKHPIMKGQFLRRSRILETVLTEFDVPNPVFEAWMAHTKVHEQAVLARAARAPGCDHDIQAGRNRTPRQKGLKNFE